MNLYKTKIKTALLMSTMLWFAACQEVELGDPNITTTVTPLFANYLLVNASPDAASLDMYINNLKAGESAVGKTAQSVYSKTALTTNGVVANTSIRAKASSGTIGGVLNTSDLIFRAGNNNANNFVASDSAYYSLIVLDSISRPKPARTLNAQKIGDTTYFNLLTGKYISGVERAPLPAAQKSKTVAIGTVPLGSSDPGGIRFLVVTDQLPLPSTTRLPKPATGKFSVRFIHASPNTGSVTVKVGANSLTTSGSTAQGIFSYPLAFSSFNPSVGSRSVTANTYATYDIGSLTVAVNQGPTEVATTAFDFQDKGVYTVVLSGNRNALPMSLIIIKNK